MRRYFFPSVLALTLAASLAAAGQGATTPLTFTVALVQQATYRHPHPPVGDPGDTFSTTQRLSAVGTVLGFPNGRRMGTMQFTWGPLKGACSTNAAECNGTTDILTLTRLPGGTITANGINVSLSHGIVLPIQGGTGIFKGVTGTVYVAPAGEHVDVFKLKDVLMESQGLIEFRYADGRVVNGDYALYARRGLTKGDELDYDGGTWLMYDREDRGGVTVHLFSPAMGPKAPEASRARRRGR